MAGNLEESFTEEDENAVLDISACIAERAEQSLAPLKEEIVDWLKKLFEVDITVENFMDFLDNGVLVSKVAEMVHTAALEYAGAGKTNDLVPNFDIKYHKNAKSGTFFARDNVAFFLEWCRCFGVGESVLFESDGLVMHRQSREVVLCLLEVARIAAKYGIEPPGIVDLEREIDAEMENDVQEEVIESDVTEEKTKHKMNNNKPVNDVQEEVIESVVTEEKTKHKLNNNKPVKKLNVDKEVLRLAKEHGVKVSKVKEGRYILEGKITIFVRILRYHVMVRVGGGWDTLDHFLSRHDPNKIGRILMVTPGSGHQHRTLSPVS